jgi:hypothetical protein
MPNLRRPLRSSATESGSGTSRAHLTSSDEASACQGRLSSSSGWHPNGLAARSSTSIPTSSFRFRRFGVSTRRCLPARCAIAATAC